MVTQFDDPLITKEPLLHKSLAAFRAAATLDKSGRNPMFKSEYSTLGDVLTALKTVTDYGLTFTQVFDGNQLVTTVRHMESGESLESTLTITPEKNTPQAFISCVTYYRRASLITMFGLNADDDDGNIASGSGAKPVTRPATGGGGSSLPPPPTLPPSDFDDQLLHCTTVRDVNALYTRLYKVKGIMPDDKTLAKFKQRKDDLNA